MRTRRTACNRDCPDACSLELKVDEQGRGISLTGVADDPVTRGFLCERTARFLDRQYSADRLTAPLMRRRRDHELLPVKWEEALDYCAQRLLDIRHESGPAAILHYRSGGSLGLLKHLSDYLFQVFGPVTVKSGDICSGAGEQAQLEDFGLCDSHDLFDLRHSRSIVVWGKNPHTSSVHLVPLLVEARRRGARIVGIDITPTRLERLSDVFLRPHPGCDAALALGAAALARQWGAHDPQAHQYCDHYDHYCALLDTRSPADWAALAGVSLAQMERLVEAVTQGPCAILVGWGMARRRNGGATVRAIDALAAVTGNLGIAGGGVSYYFRRRAAFDLSFGAEGEGTLVTPTPPPLPSGEGTRRLREACLGRDLLAAQDPPVRAVWVTAGNPLSMLPDSGVVRRAFAKTEFVAVVDTHPTDTTDVADVVLPTLTLLEDDDLLGAYGNHYLRVSRPALEPPGQARHELWIWQELARRWGFPDKLAGSPREWKARLCPAVSLDELERGPVRNPLAPTVLFQGRRFPTPSGKVNLIHHLPALPAPDPDYPLTLLAVSSPQSQSSQWAVEPGRPAQVRVHPSALANLQEPCALESRRGRMQVQVVADEGVHPGLAWMSKGRMDRHGGCPNLLVEASETDLGGGAVFYDEPVRLVADEGIMGAL